LSDMIPGDQGRLRRILIADPVAGADFVTVQPDRVRWRIISLYARLANDANAGNRIVRLSIADGALVLMNIETSTDSIANETVNVNFYSGAVAMVSASSRSMNGALPEKLLLNGGVTITSNTLDLQAGDQFTNIRLYVEEWIEPLV